EEKIKKIVQENTDFAKSLKEETKETFTNNSKIIEETLKVNRESLTSIIKEHTQGFEEQKERIKSSLVESLNSYLGELRRTVSSFKEQTSQLIRGHLEDYNKTISEAKEKTVETLSNHSGTLIQTVNQIQSKLGETLNKHESDVRLLIDKIQSYLSSNLEKTENSIATYINETSSAVTTLFEKTENDSEKTAELLKSAWEELEKSKLNEIQKTWHLATKESIITHIVDMVRRASRSITIIVPNLQDIPTGELLKKEESVIIHLVTDFGEEETKEVEKLLKKKIRIWKNTRGKLYGCIRDQQETLLAPLNAAEIPVAVVSEEEGYAKVYQNIILPNLIAKAQEIKPLKTEI
ncbi:MAG: hypothetical protein Q6367_014280, partial [Candidatus Freyarchaeota archaeon]